MLTLTLEQILIQNPEYNVLKVAGSSDGIIHLKETIAKMSRAKSEEKHPRFGLNHSDNYRTKMSIAAQNRNKDPVSGITVEVLDLLGAPEPIIYDSMRKAAIAM